MTRIKKFIKYIFDNKILTVPVIVLVVIGIVSAVVWRLSIASQTVADFFVNTVSFGIRFVLTHLTYYLPFSLAEFMLYASVPLVLYLAVNFIFKIIYVRHKSRAAVFFKGIFRFIAFLGGFLFIFTFTLGVCYGRTSIDKIMEKTLANQNIKFERRLLSTDDLADSLEILIGEANKTADNIKYIYADTGSTQMPYNLSELNKKLNESYKNLLEKNNFLKRIQAKVKPVVASIEMSQMHITGVYAFFTGEANVNIDFPDYNLPFTAAHEMSHLMGIAREDEANFTAFLVCLYSDDNYIRYSGLVNMIEYVGNALYSADKDKYNQLMGGLSYVIKNEMTAYSIFFDKYRNTKISKVASAVNDTYLKAQGQEQGEKSYGLVVDLAVAYLLDVYGK
ncbi:MAG: DUF3810 domain-containing protein [Oscillospiraceae bacterium]|nr:DUF3810 domain-containing protein [Oscillospiraceae bacterium]